MKRLVILIMALMLATGCAATGESTDREVFRLARAAFREIGVHRWLKLEVVNEVSHDDFDMTVLATEYEGREIRTLLLKETDGEWETAAIYATDPETYYWEGEGLYGFYDVYDIHTGERIREHTLEPIVLTTGLDN